MIVIGIDPGQTGAIAAIEGALVTRVIKLADMPTSARLHGKGQQVDASVITSIFMDIGPAEKVVNLEAVSAMPGQGVSSTFRFGESVGVILGVCGALQIPVRWVTPAIWKKRAGLTGKDKDAARTLAIQMHPEVSDMLNLKKHVGRADAILIAEFGNQPGRI